MLVCDKCEPCNFGLDAEMLVCIAQCRQRWRQGEAGRLSRGRNLAAQFSPMGWWWAPRANQGSGPRTPTHWPRTYCTQIADQAEEKKDRDGAVYG